VRQPKVSKHITDRFIGGM